MEPIHKLENKRFLKTLENKSDIDKHFADQARFLATKQKFDRIDNFNDEFDFLNNEFEAPVVLEGETYPTVAAAYLAARTPLPVFRKKLQGDLDTFEFFDLAKQIPNPPDWDARKLGVMEQLVRDKFVRNPEIRTKLAETGSRELVNAFRDKTPANLYWGAVEGEGQNHLGKILMETRSSILKDTDITDWLKITFSLAQEKPMCADFSAKVHKEGQVVETLQFRAKPWFEAGNSQQADFPMAHPSISRRHCIFWFDFRLGVVVMDLGSTNGTRVDGADLAPFIPHKVDSIRFQLVCGQSTRTNEITADFTFLKRHLEKERRRLTDGEKSVAPEGDSTKIHISGFGVTPRRRELERLFDKFGEVRTVDIFENTRRREGGWYGFVRFQGSRAVARVLREPGIYLGDQKIGIGVANK